MMKNPEEFYKSQINETELKLSVIKRKLVWLSVFRFLVFGLTLGLCYLLWHVTNAPGIVALLGLVLFLMLVSKYTNLKHERNYYRYILSLNQNELVGLAGDLSPFRSGKEYGETLHAFSQDMDLFGKGSIFQLINRTASKTGELKLANILKSNGTHDIVKKQEAIRELAAKAHWRQNFSAQAGLIQTETDPADIAAWMALYQPKLPGFLRTLAVIFSAVSGVLFLMVMFSFVDWVVLLFPFFTGLMIAGIFIANVNRINQMATRLTQTFMQYAKILKALEQEKFDADLLKQLQQAVQTEDGLASEKFEELGGYLSKLDQRNNVFFALAANGYFLWDVRYASHIESWIVRNRKMVATCFESIAFFDAYNSLSNYAFNHPDHVYPIISPNALHTIKAEKLGHPLLKKTKRVTNDFEIGTDQFFIITGANMAGKSTFLRTVGTSIVLANTGLPVCAVAFDYVPIKLISSMRSSDSLQDEESYFFAELKRLKYIVDEIQTDRYFIILDEILKGTNSKDKEEGSKKFVQRLVTTKSTGIIATHDLSLCQLAEGNHQIKNHYFDAEIVNDELYFDYTFKDGICKNMNASFLLRKMKIVE